jgi:hypothetical protein
LTGLSLSLTTRADTLPTFPHSVNMADHHDHDHDHGNLTFVGSPGRACVGFLVAFLAYFVGSFEYVENQPSELAKQSARCARSWCSWVIGMDHQPVDVDTCTAE